LATTEPQKVPATIRSRTQHLEFRLLTADTLQALLETVREQGALDVNDASLQAAVRKGHGSARDALSALDQVVASGPAETVRPEISSVVSAIAEGEASAVLVSLSALFADGWGPQQLATELVDDFRQAFLAALAPDLCAVSGSERAEFVAVAESLGLARVVRSMELLGHALVDMRDAPDAQVVLEIATVRASRPDLDEGTAALAERVSLLERSLSGNGQHPGQPVPTPASEPAIPVSVDAEPAPARAADIARKPSVGAVLRGRAEPSPTAAGPEPAPRPEQAATTDAREPAPSSNVAIDRDALTQAWGDGVLHGLSARAKALYSAGRFVSTDSGEAHFALPNAAHRDRCEQLSNEVQSALSTHFKAPVRLVLVVEGGREPSATNGTIPPDARAAPPGASDVGLDDEDPEVLEAAPPAEDHQASAVDRLLQAFPGTSEVEEQ
jgi:DNA polymerase-3 subunit gamma/tau